MFIYRIWNQVDINKTILKTALAVCTNSRFFALKIPCTEINDWQHGLLFTDVLIKNKFGIDIYISIFTNVTESSTKNEKKKELIIDTILSIDTHKLHII